MPRRAIAVTLTDADRHELARWRNAHRTPQQVALRCGIVLAAADGQQDKTIALSLGINRQTVALWRRRFRQEGPKCLWKTAPGRGRKPVFQHVGPVKDASRGGDGSY
jgi:hypothetical protein